MLSSGEVDYIAWAELLRSFENVGIAGVIVFGTTAESVNLTLQEREQLLEIAAKTLTTKWFVGVGHPSMQQAIEYSAQAIKYNPDGFMVVTPYYNRPMKSGLVDYFSVILDLGLPVMAYNVPSRTGIDVGVEVWDELLGYDNFVAIKEASPDLMRVNKLVSRYPKLTILSGNDSQILEFMRLGGHGIVSVLANAVPAEFSLLCQHCFLGNWQAASEVFASFGSLIIASDRAVNPVAIKCILHKLGRIDLGIRLPLKITQEIYDDVVDAFKEETC